nr:RepB family plasmid replication initiator protein [Staphylococcus sp. GDY8P168P-1]
MNYFRYKQFNKDVITVAVGYYLRYALSYRDISEILREDFRERLDISNSYRMSNINQFVLNTIIKELSTIFKNLHINKIKVKKGRKIEWLEFTFDTEKRIHNKRQPQMANIDKSRQYISLEKTPKWLEERTYEKTTQNEYDQQLEKEREAFLKQLEVDWEE